MAQPRKNYKFYLKISANQILTKRGFCPHKYKWEDEKVLYFRCRDCGSFVPFRNPEDIKRYGELTAADAEPEFPCSHIEYIPSELDTNSIGVIEVL